MGVGVISSENWAVTDPRAWAEEEKEFGKWFGKDKDAAQ